MNRDKKTLFVLSDVNFDFLKNHINPIYTIDCSNYNEYHKIFYSEDDNSAFKKSDYHFIWPSPERVSSEFHSLRNFQKMDEQKLEKDVINYIDKIKDISKGSKGVLLPLLNSFNNYGSLGIGNMAQKIGHNFHLHEANSFIINNLKDQNNIYLIDSFEWFRKCSKNIDEKLWFRGKMPFSIEFMKEMRGAIYSAIKTIEGMQKKMLVVDLDNTLWGGVSGDIGWENIKIGGHDPLGEVYLQFQKELKNLTKRGVLLAACSKNNYQTVKDTFTKNNYMHLQLDDFCDMQVNWNDKATNLISISKSTNINIDSFVFIDDSPYERDLVKSELPEVFVPDFPSDIYSLPSWINSLDCFDTIEFTNEDLNRNLSMIQNKQKDEMKKNNKDLGSWIKSLDIVLEVSIIKDQDFRRTFQLMNKTNQMNLSTNRYIEKDLKDLINNDEYIYYKVDIYDKFSSKELMGVLGIKVLTDKLELQDFILSCRAFGRNIEITMIETLRIISKNMNKKFLEPKIISTDKNILCQEFFKKILINNDPAEYEPKDKLLYFSSHKTSLKLTN